MHKQFYNYRILTTDYADLQRQRVVFQYAGKEKTIRNHFP